MSSGWGASKEALKHLSLHNSWSDTEVIYKNILFMSFMIEQKDVAVLWIGHLATCHYNKIHHIKVWKI